MADTMKYSLWLSHWRALSRRCCKIMQAQVGSQLEFSHPDSQQATEVVVIRHVYIERRSDSIELVLQELFDALNERPDDTAVLQQLQHVVVEYGNAIKDMVAANIFPGDMLWKTLASCNGKVVFTITTKLNTSLTATSARSRHLATRRTKCRARFGAGGPRDAFPETFAPLLLGQRQGARCVHGGAIAGFA